VRSMSSEEVGEVLRERKTLTPSRAKAVISVNLALADLS
jgi:hypothetical protein